jgi:hypothetical protein
LLLVTVFQDKDNTILRCSTHVLDQVALNDRGSRSRSFFAVRDGNTASRSSMVLSLLDDGRAQGVLKLFELFTFNKLLSQRNRFRKATVIMRVTTPAAFGEKDE